jgi:hypothetical protein
MFSLTDVAAHPIRILEGPEISNTAGKSELKQIVE